MRSKKHEIMLRLPPETLEKIDAVVTRLRSERPGLPITRAGVARMLLETALAAYESSGSAPEKECPTCRGRGRIDGMPCPDCTFASKP